MGFLKLTTAGLRADHLHFQVRRAEFSQLKKSGRRLWIAFGPDTNPNAKFFYLHTAEIVILDEIPHFRECLAKSEQHIGFAFKKIDPRFLNKVGEVLAIRDYEKSDEDFPDFILLKTGYKKLWS